MVLTGQAVIKTFSFAMQFLVHAYKGCNKLFEIHIKLPVLMFLLRRLGFDLPKTKILVWGDEQE